MSKPTEPWTAPTLAALARLTLNISQAVEAALEAGLPPTTVAAILTQAAELVEEDATE